MAPSSPSSRPYWTVRLLTCLAVALCGVVATEGAVRADRAIGGPWILIDTQARSLSVYDGDALLDRFENIAIGRNGFAEDRVRGDGTTPLGTFHINRIRRSSRFLKFFRIDYPLPEHAERALETGRISTADYERIVRAFEENRPPPQNTPLGGQLGLHGVGGGDPRIHEAFDWTKGCVALTNAQVERLSQWMYLGMPVQIR